METGAIQLVVTACGCDTAYAKTLLLVRILLAEGSSMSWIGND